MITAVFLATNKSPENRVHVCCFTHYFRKHDCARFDVRDGLKGVQTPAFIYCGYYDAQCPLKFGEEVANLMPNASFTLFNHSNHHPYDEEEEAFRRFVESTI